MHDVSVSISSANFLTVTILSSSIVLHFVLIFSTFCFGSDRVIVTESIINPDILYSGLG